MYINILFWKRDLSKLLKKTFELLASGCNGAPLSYRASSRNAFETTRDEYTNKFDQMSVPLR